MHKRTAAAVLAAAAGLVAPLAVAPSAEASTVIVVCSYKVTGHNVNIRTAPKVASGNSVGQARTGSTATSAPATSKNGFIKANWMDVAGHRHAGTWLSSSYVKNLGCHREPA